ncbi:MAG: nucleotidyltransferase domain-containing protein [Bacteroidales bacterium]
MIGKKQILIKIKQLVAVTEPDATVILYGSFARGDNKKYSDIDILILVDKDRISIVDEKRIKYPLYDLEFDTGKIISPIVFTRNDWETRHKITPFYNTIKREGIQL